MFTKTEDIFLSITANFPPAPNPSYNYDEMVPDYVQNPSYNNESLAASPCDSRLLTSPCGPGSVSSGSAVSPNQLSTHTSPDPYTQYQQWRDPINGEMIIRYLIHVKYCQIVAAVKNFDIPQILYYINLDEEFFVSN